MRCEGYRRYGGAFTLGPVQWEQCSYDATIILTVVQDGKTQTMPACGKCWKEAVENKIEIKSVGEIPPKNELADRHMRNLKNLREEITRVIQARRAVVNASRSQGRADKFKDKMDEWQAASNKAKALAEEVL